jgi:ABC-2 type transport system ATP-binding protein
MTSVVSVKGLTKTYSSGLHALKGVDLEIRRGEIFACWAPTAPARRR